MKGDFYRLRKAIASSVLIAFLLLPGNPFSVKISGQGKTDAKAGVSGTINCVNASVTLLGNSDSPNARFTWTGPGNFRATSRNAVTSVPGTYTLKVVAASGITTATVDVKVDTVPPENVKTATSGILTCADTIIFLTGSSSTPGVTYNWKGTKGYVSSEKQSAVKLPGIYNLTVTNPANGCSSFASAEVKQNIVRPEGVTASVSGVLTCKAPGAMLSGSSVTKDVSFNWTGPDFTSKQQKAETKSPGKYVLTVTNPVNGCNSTATVTVIQNTKEPEGAKAMALDTLTCKTSKVKLSASSTSGGTVYKWTGPGNFTSQTQNTIAVAPGNYTVEITDPATGCFAKRSVIVLKNIKEPETDIAPSGVLTCSVKSVTLKTKPAVKNTTYKWSGPDGFSSASPEPSVVKAGVYSATVTSTSTGCSSSKSIEVKENMASPQGVVVKATGSLSCATPKVKLSGNSATEGVTYSWSGPQDFTSTLKTPEVTLPGTYTLHATNPENGCVSKADVTVQGEKCTEK